MGLSILKNKLENSESYAEHFSQNDKEGNLPMELRFGTAFILSPTQGLNWREHPEMVVTTS